MPYYALALGTAASAALLLPTALFDVRQEDPDDPNSPHTAVPRQLPALLAELLEDEDCIKAMDHPVPTSAATSAGGVVTEPLQPTMVAARLADDFRTLEPSSLVSVQQFVAGRRDDAVQLSVQPSSATLQELAALHLGEFLPPVDSAAARKVYTAKLSRPPLLTEIRLLALRAHAAARLYAEAADWSSSHYVPVT